jgi:hypothetical protein
MSDETAAASASAAVRSVASDCTVSFQVKVVEAAGRSASAGCSAGCVVWARAVKNPTATTSIMIDRKRVLTFSSAFSIGHWAPNLNPMSN